MTGVKFTRHVGGRPRGARGFTLMELLVALSIFSTVVAAATDIFLMANRSQRKILALERAQADARFTMETIAREFRNDQVDYAYYADRPQPESGPLDRLALIDGGGNSIRFGVSEDGQACADAASSPCLVVAVNEGSPTAVSAPFTPKGVVVRNAKFYLAPTVDPVNFNPVSGMFDSDIQPRVTIVLVLESVSAHIQEQTLTYFQTTVTNRNYRR